MGFSLVKLMDLALAIRDDVLSVLTPTDGSPTNIRTDQYGDVWTSLGTKLDSVNDSVTADTELPSASTIAADAVTPTVPGLAAYGFIKTPGANTWDRLYSIVNATNSTGTGIMAVGNLAQFDDTSPTAITENQFGNLRMSTNRNQYMTIRDAAGNERGVNVTAGNALATDKTSIAGTAIVNGGTAGSQSVGGIVANNGTINSAVNPILVGGQAVSSENAANTTAKLSQFVTDLVGKLIVLPFANPENFVNGTTAAITDTTSTSVIASAGGSLRNYITSILVTNSHATVGTFVKILDGSTIIWEGYAAAAGGGFSQSFPVPLKGTAATAVNAQPVTTGANVIVSCAGYKGI